MSRRMRFEDRLLNLIISRSWSISRGWGEGQNSDRKGL